MMRPKEARPSFCLVRTSATLRGGSEAGEGGAAVAVVMSMVLLLSSLPDAAGQRGLMRYVRYAGAVKDRDAAGAYEGGD